MRRAKTLFLILIILAFSFALRAQILPSDLSLIVTDMHQHVIVGATCSLSRAGKTVLTKTTDENGVANFSSLRNGIYDLRIEKEGFAKFEKRGLQPSNGPISI